MAVIASMAGGGNEAAVTGINKRIRPTQVTALAVLVAAAISAACAVPARAVPAYVFSELNQLVTFDTATPGTVTIIPLTLPAGQQVIGLDYRPGTGEFFAATVPTGSLTNSVISLYRLEIGGTMTFVGQTAAPLPGAGAVATGFDFNPVTDQGSLVNANDENARLNPNGTLFSDDTDLSPAASVQIVAAAYDRNAPGGSATTLYAIDAATDRLVTIGGIDGSPSPAGGVVTTVGSLGFNTDDAGFDIAPNGTAFASLKTGADAELYTINLATGTATLVGDIGSANNAHSLAIPVPSPPTPTAEPVPDPEPPPPTPEPLDTTAPRGLLDIGANPKIRRVIRTGLDVGFSCSEACNVAAVLKVGKRTLARGTSSLADADAGEIEINLTESGRRKLEQAADSRKDLLRTTIRVTFTDASGNTSTLDRKLALTS